MAPPPGHPIGRSLPLLRTVAGAGGLPLLSHGRPDRLGLPQKSVLHPSIADHLPQLGREGGLPGGGRSLALVGGVRGRLMHPLLFLNLLLLLLLLLHWRLHIGNAASQHLLLPLRSQGLQHGSLLRCRQALQRRGQLRSLPLKRLLLRPQRRCTLQQCASISRAALLVPWSAGGSGRAAAAAAWLQWLGAGGRRWGAHRKMQRLHFVLMGLLPGGGSEHMRQPQSPAP